MATHQGVIQLIKHNVDEADAIVARELKLAPGIFKDALRAERLVDEVEPLWDEKPRNVVEQLLKAVVELGYLERQPASESVCPP